MTDTPRPERLPMKWLAASAEHERYYQEAMTAIATVTARYPDIRTIEVIAMLGRATGYVIAAAFPDERDLARQTAIENMDQGTRDVAQTIPERKGVRQ